MYYPCRVCPTFTLAELTFVVCPHLAVAFTARVHCHTPNQVVSDSLVLRCTVERSQLLYFLIPYSQYEVSQTRGSRCKGIQQ